MLVHYPIKYSSHKPLVDSWQLVCQSVTSNVSLDLVSPWQFYLIPQNQITPYVSPLSPCRGFPARLLQNSGLYRLADVSCAKSVLFCAEWPALGLSPRPGPTLICERQVQQLPFWAGDVFPLTLCVWALRTAGRAAEELLWPLEWGHLSEKQAVGTASKVPSFGLMEPLCAHTLDSLTDRQSHPLTVFPDFSFILLGQDISNMVVFICCHCRNEMAGMK